MSLIVRYAFLGFANGALRVRRTDGVRNIALFSSGQRRYLYAESNMEDMKPDMLVEGELLPYPDGSHWQRMTDVFHYSAPQSAEHWVRKYPDRQPEMCEARLRPECVTAYVHYHYLLQEERPRLLQNKFSLIFLLGDRVIMYGERPNERDTADYLGKLDTHSRPADISARVDRCFRPWDDGTPCWRRITPVDAALD